MAPRRGRPGEARVAFDALSIEGGLLGAGWLGKVAHLQAAAQEPADYHIPKGLHVRDEIVRSWRIAQACFREMESGRASGGGARALAERFLEAFLRDAFGFASLTRAAPTTIGERVYPVRFFALGDRVPVVSAPAGAGLDTPLPELGDDRHRRSAFGLLQETLNASGAALWGLAADGLRLRIARDNASLTRPAWIEADLGRIFTEELYPDFAALWLLAHESRFGRAGEPPETCPLEAWREAGRQEGTRARDKLSDGFRQALAILGQGFLSHAANRKLRRALHAGDLTRERYFGQLLRLVYRLVFLLTVEERNLLHPKNASGPARRLYAEGYALRRLRDRAVRGSAHDRQRDLWEAVTVVFRGLAGGEPRLGLPALAGLFAPEECPDLDAAKIENRALLDALFHLAWLREPSGAGPRELAGHGAGRARLRLRGPARAGPADHRGRTLLLLRGRRREPGPCTEDHRQLLHAGRARATPPRERPRSRGPAHDRRASRGPGRCPSRSGDPRPRLRVGTLPARRGPPPRRSRRAPPGRGHACAGRLPARAPRRRPAVHPRRRREPAGRRDLQGGALDGVHRSGPAPHVPGEPRPLRQLAHRHEPRTDGRARAGRRVGGPRRRRPEGHRGAQAAQPGRDRRSATPPVRASPRDGCAARGDASRRAGPGHGRRGPGREAAAVAGAPGLASLRAREAGGRRLVRRLPLAQGRALSGRGGRAHHRRVARAPRRRRAAAPGARGDDAAHRR